MIWNDKKCNEFFTMGRRYKAKFQYIYLNMTTRFCIYDEAKYQRDAAKKYHNYLFNPSII